MEISAFRVEDGQDGNMTGYDSKGRVVYQKFMVHDEEVETKYKYDIYGNIVRVEDSNGNQIWYTFVDGQPKFTYSRGPNGKIIRFEFNTDGELVYIAELN